MITKIIPMPGDLDEDDLEDQVELEAVNYIPYPIEEVSLDFEVLGPMPNNPEMVQVLLAASRTENVDVRAVRARTRRPHRQGHRRRGLRDGERLHAASPTSCRCRATAIVALVDIGATMTTLNVLRNAAQHLHAASRCSAASSSPTR